jgi:hemoglobin
MSTVDGAARALSASDEPITDDHARTLARLLREAAHDEALERRGGGSLAQFHRNGTIGRGLAPRLRRWLRLLANTNADEEIRYNFPGPQLAALLHYALAHGLRAAQPGWEQVRDDLPLDDAILLPWEEGQSFGVTTYHHGGAEDDSGPSYRFMEGWDDRDRVWRNDTLYGRLGGPEGITELVEVLYERIVGDPLMAPVFEGFNMRRIKKHQVAVLILAAGGPNLYVGRSLRLSHLSLSITPEIWNRFIAILGRSLAQRGIDDGDIEALAEALTSYRHYIVSA